MFTRDLSEIGKVEGLLLDIFLYSYLVPTSTATNGDEVDVTPSQTTGKDLWQEWVKGASETSRDKVMTIVMDRLRALIQDTDVQSV